MQLNPLCPLTTLECERIAKFVFDEIDHRKETDILFIRFQAKHPHTGVVPEEIEIETPNPGQQTIIRNFWSYNGIYAPAILYNTITQSACAYLPENLGKMGSFFMPKRSILTSHYIKIWKIALISHLCLTPIML